MVRWLAHNMNCSTFGLILAFGIGVFELFGQNAATAKPPHFLIVVDKSFSMLRIDESTRLTVSNLVYTGIQGQMRPGDALKMWIFNEHIYESRYPSLTWDPALNQALANGAVKFIKEQPYQKQTRLDVLLTALYQTVKTASHWTVILISDGDERFQGTPFDAPLNAIYQQHFRELRLAKKPFVTTLAAQDGRFAAYSVSAAGEEIAFDDIAQQLAKDMRMEAMTQSSPPATLAQRANSRSQAQSPAATHTPAQLDPKAGVKAPTTKVAPAPMESPSQTAVPSSPATTNAANLQIAVPPITPNKTEPPPTSVTIKSEVDTDKTKANTASTLANTNLTLALATLVQLETPPPVVKPHGIPVTPPSHSLRVGVDSNRFSILQPSPPPSVSSETKRPITPATAAASPQMDQAAPVKPSVTKAPITPQPTAIVEPFLHQRGYLILSFLVLVAGSGLCYWLAQHRRSPRQPSFISRSIERDTK